MEDNHAQPVPTINATIAMSEGTLPATAGVAKVEAAVDVMVVTVAAVVVKAEDTVVDPGPDPEIAAHPEEDMITAGLEPDPRVDHTRLEPITTIAAGAHLTVIRGLGQRS